MNGETMHEKATPAPGEAASNKTIEELRGILTPMAARLTLEITPAVEYVPYPEGRDDEATG